MAIGSSTILSTSRSMACAAAATKVLLRNYYVASSILHSSAKACARYDQILVSFWYYSVYFSPLDEFFLEYSPDGGHHWMIIRGWARTIGQQFLSNQSCNQAQVLIPANDLGGYTDLVKFRFRANSGPNDRIYILDIHVVGIIFSSS